MVNKRGLSPDEFYDLDPEVLELLMVYDSYIEPSGTYIDMLFHAHANYNTTINNPNLTSTARRSIKVEDFDFLGILDSKNLTVKEKAEERERKQKEKQANDLKTLGFAIKKQASGKKKK